MARGLINLGGALALGFGGGYLGFLVGLTILGSESIHNSSSPGAAIAGVIMFGLSTLAGAVLGAATGYGVFRLMNLNPKLIWIQTPLALFGYGAVMFGMFQLAGLSSRMEATVRAGEEIRSKSEHDISVRNDAFVKQAKIDLPFLMGSLMYPGSDITGGLMAGKDYASVALRTKASEQDVDRYYRPLLSEATGSGIGLSGKVIRPGDGRTLLFSVTRAGHSIQLIFITVARNEQNSVKASSEPKPSPVDSKSALESDPGWPDASANQEVTSAYGNLVYPGSHTNFASSTPPRLDIPASLVALASSDGMTKAVEYYRPLVDVKVDNPEQFNGITTRVSDGRRTFVSIQSKGGFTMITLSSD